MTTWQPDWSKLPTWARYAVVKFGGEVGMATDMQPEIKMAGTIFENWFSIGGRVHLFSPGPNDGNWRESLRERPTEA